MNQGKTAITFSQEMASAITATGKSTQAMDVHFDQENTTGFTYVELHSMNAVMTAKLASEGLPPTEDECEETGDEGAYSEIRELVMLEMDRRIAKSL